MNNSDEEFQPPRPDQDAIDFGTLLPGSTKIFHGLLSNPNEEPMLCRVDRGETNWLSLKEIDTFLPGQQRVIEVTANARSLAIGEYPASVTFIAEREGSSSSKTVPVNLKVASVLPLSVGLSFTLNVISSKTLPLAIINQNDMQMEWSADVGGADWVTLDRKSGTLRPNEQQTIHVTADTNSLHEGDYRAFLTFSSQVEGVQAESMQLAVELHVTSRPYGDDGPKPPIGVNLRRSGTGRTPHILPLILEFTNPEENGSVDWTIRTGRVGWLCLSKDQGTLGPGVQERVDVTVDTTGVPAGPYRTDLTLTFAFNPPRGNREPTSIVIPFPLTVP